MQTQTGGQGASGGFLLNKEGPLRLSDYGNDDTKDER